MQTLSSTLIAMPPHTYKVFRLAVRPGASGVINDSTFRMEELPYEELKPGPKQVLFKTIYLSCDPTQRTWINDARGYMKPVKVGDVMRSGGIAVVVEAGEGSVFKPGDTVHGLTGTCLLMNVRMMRVLNHYAGWREYGVLHDGAFEKLVYVSHAFVNVARPQA